MMNLDIKRLTVKYNQKTVGYLQVLEDNRIAFQYDDEWIKSGFSISPFSLPLDTRVFISDSPYFEGLYGVFRDSIPDGWGELIMRRKLGKLGINYDRISPLTKLSLVRSSGLGGLDYEPTQGLDDNPIDTDLDSIASEIERILESKDSEEDLDHIYKLGGASGGARPKVHLNINKEEWIIKFPSSMDTLNIGEKEFEADNLSRKSGIRTNDFNLFPSKRTSGYFGAKRFDRINDEKRHVISLSSLLETTHRIPNLDYKHLFQVTNAICDDKEEMYEVFKRMVFNVLYGNKDDHGKNFAFIYDETIGSYMLTPAYDITKTTDKFEHEMTVNNSSNPTIDDIIKLSQDMRLSQKRCDEIIHFIEKTVKA